MALRLVGVDPNCSNNNCPTIWDDGDTYVIKGWRVTDAATLVEVGEVPAGESIIRLPKHMVQVSPDLRKDG